VQDAVRRRFASEPTHASASGTPVAAVEHPQMESLEEFVARLTRHELKQDELGAQLSSIRDAALKHKKTIALSVSALIVALSLGFGINYYIRSQQTKAAAAFAKALNTYHAPVMTTPPAGLNIEVYKTNDEKNQKSLDAFNTVAKDYSSYVVGRLAKYYAAICLRDLGKKADAEKAFQELTTVSDSNIASLAKFGLGGVYEATNRASEAEKIYKDLEQHPTAAVPKATATLALADMYRRSNTAEATTLYNQIKKDYAGTPAADYADQMLGGMAQ
jgi:TolA-binding protein